jgi:hypothetical protein
VEFRLKVPLCVPTTAPFNYRNAYAFGPKYNESINRNELDQRYMTDLNTLVEAGHVEKQQLFYRDATSLLRVHSDLGSVSSLFRVAKTPLEREFVLSLTQALADSR